MGIADIALEIGQGDSARNEEVDIITFVESDWGLGVRLYPVQRVILKVYYGIPLDDSVENVPIPVGEQPWLRRNVVNMTEAGYLRFLHQENRCNISEVTEDQALREMVLSIGRRSGKCKAADSLVVTSQGLLELQELGDVAGPEVQPLKVGVAQEKGKRAESAYFYCNGVHETRRLQMFSGFVDESTPNHRLKVLGSDGVVRWRYVRDIHVGDYVAINRSTNLWPEEEVPVDPVPGWDFPQTVDSDFGLLLGYLVGDGNRGAASYLALTGSFPQVQRFSEISRKVIGHPGRLYQEPRSKRTWNWRFDQKDAGVKGAGRIVRGVLDSLGFRLDAMAWTKRVPWVIRKSPRLVVASFLRGLFEVDGNVSKTGEVSLSTASLFLAREVQLLLLNMGVVSRIRNKRNRKYKREYYDVMVLGSRSLELFHQIINFDSPLKQALLREAVLKQADHPDNGPNTELIPHQRQWCHRLLDSVPKGGRMKLREALGNTINPSFTDEMVYPRLRKVLPVAREMGAAPDILSHFSHLEDLDYFFDPVVGIEKGKGLTFDLNVPDGESFVANGMTNHNTFISACIVAYEIYKLILKGEPQAYYGLGSTSEIGVVSVATDKDQAGLLYNEASGHFSKCAFFHPYTANNTMSYAKFQTPADIKRFGRYKDDPSAKATLKVTFKSCVAKGLRGAGNMVVILDELAHFNDVGQSDAEKIYDAITPSAATFSQVKPETEVLGEESAGDSDGRIISISSPLGKQGFFYENYMKGYSGGLESKDMFCIQAPTWEVNPRVKSVYFAKKYAKKAATFFTEFGAEFTSATRGWVQESELLPCLDTSLRPKTQAPSRMPHFMGVDLGLVGNGTAVAIGHIEGEMIVTDLVEQIKAGEGKYAGVERLDFDEVADWVYAFTRRFYIVGGIFDQWAGIPFEQALVKKGLTQLKAEHMTKNLNSQIYQNAKDMIWDGKLVLYDHPIEEGKAHSDFVQEILDLQAQYQSKYVTIVEAPQVEGKFDDRSDAWVRMIWLASNALGKTAHFSRGSRSSKTVTATQAIHRGAYLKTRRMGSSPDRQAPRASRGVGRRIL